MADKEKAEALADEVEALATKVDSEDPDAGAQLHATAHQMRGRLES